MNGARKLSLIPTEKVRPYANSVLENEILERVYVRDNNNSTHLYYSNNVAQQERLRTPLNRS